MNQLDRFIKRMGLNVSVAALLSGMGTSYAATSPQYRVFEGIVLIQREGITPAYESYAPDLALHRAMLKCFREGFTQCGKLNPDGGITDGKPSTSSIAKSSQKVIDGGAVASNVISFPLAVITFGALNGAQDVVKTKEDNTVKVTVVGAKGPDPENIQDEYRIFEVEGLSGADTYDPNADISAALNQAMSSCFKAGFFRCGKLNSDGSISHGLPTTQPLHGLYFEENIELRALAENVSMIPIQVITFGTLGGNWKIFAEQIHYKTTVAVVGVRPKNN